MAHIRMRIKKHPNNNQYVITPHNMWVRNFCLNNVPFVDLNETIKSSDHFLFLTNEVQNNFKKYQWVDSEQLFHPNVIIVSDGFDFKKNHHILSQLPKNITIIGVNGALLKW